MKGVCPFVGGCAVSVGGEKVLNSKNLSNIVDCTQMILKCLKQTFKMSLTFQLLQIFFSSFLKDTFAKWQKKRSLKKNLALAHSSLKKKYKIPLCSKKWNCMKTSPYLQVGAVLKHHYNVNPFLQKKNHKITIFHRNLVWFSFFFQNINTWADLQFTKNQKIHCIMPLQKLFFDY